MTTTPVGSTSSTGSQVKSKSKELTTDDFIKMMVTQLQNQDPTQPATNQELLSQMSQIGQLQSANSTQATMTGLQDSLKALVLQNQIGSAGNLIGKTVQGLDANGKKISGVVNSVRVDEGGVSLELDTGKSLNLGNVTSIGSGPSAKA